MDKWNDLFTYLDTLHMEMNDKAIWHNMAKKKYSRR